MLLNAEKRNGEPSASSTFNNVWGNLYSTLKNARIAINISSNEVTGNYTTKGIGEVLAAINAGLIADSFGDTPFSQAALPELANRYLLRRNGLIVALYNVLSIHKRALAMLRHHLYI